jgi:sialate O-acetylesterase
MPHKFARAVLVLAALLAAPAAAAQPLLHAMFQDHGVLQRDRPLIVWGKAKPGDDLRIEIAGQQSSAKVAKDGSWRVELPALPAGGPHELVVTAASGASQTVRDVLVGDVWLCSGQSNMEFAVSQGLNGAGEIGSANDPEVRLLTVTRDAAPAPRSDFKVPVSWQPVTPASIRDFSAACWFMARELRKTEKVPFGLVDATWGGTAVNPWRSEASFRSDMDAREDMALLDLYRRDRPAAAQQWGRTLAGWWRSRSAGALGDPWRAGAPGQWKPVPAFDFWEGWGVPELNAYNGIVWYRTEVTLTAAQARQAATLTLGIVDDLDMSFVNEVPVGTTNAWDEPRSYPVAPGTLKPGVNRIAVGALDTYGPGGMYGKPEQRALTFADGSRVLLPPAAKWSYLATPGIGDPPHAPWETIAGMSGIYNAMIAPIGPYRLRGVAWYQGEADAGNPNGYAGRLAGLMAGWRAQFGDPELPFAIVQLAGWGPRNAVPVESGFADIREEQRRAALADTRAGIAVAIDIGDVGDIHPANKQDVGLRLARVARVLAYGAKQSRSGAEPIAAKREGQRVTIRFGSVEKALVAYSAGAPTGFELCGLERGSCRFVSATLEGDSVGIDLGGRTAARVRYCWGDSPVCNLYDGSGLPVTPFELAIQ